MIKVSPKPEYAGFNAAVRSPGAAFLAGCPAPTSKQFSQKNFWSRAASELYGAYAGICAYTAMYLPDRGTVDHFLPKHTHPQLAYEWSNYRLCSGRVNSSKGHAGNVLDPFLIQDDWFYLSVPTCLIVGNPALPKELRAQISTTINTLRLNQDDHHVQERCNILMEYAADAVTLTFLEKRYPFLAREVKRQNLDAKALRALFRM